MPILIPIDSRFCVSFPQAFIGKFIRIYYIHKVFNKGPLLASLGTPPLNEITLANSENHADNQKMS